MTSRYSPASHPGTRDGTMLLDRLHRICRASRIVPACRGKQRRYPKLITPDRQYKNLTHQIGWNVELNRWTTVRISAPSTLKSAPYAGGNAWRTKSTLAHLGRRSILTSSRNLRRRRFRLTMIWPYLGTMTATRQ